MSKEVITIIISIFVGIGLGIIFTIPMRLREIEKNIKVILIRTREIDRNIFELKEKNK